jgi:hypothetical protein
MEGLRLRCGDLDIVGMLESLAIYVIMYTLKVGLRGRNHFPFVLTHHYQSHPTFPFVC